MRAVVRRGPQLSCEEIADPVPETGQVLVRTLACGICGSDLHALHHLEHMMDLSRRAGGLTAPADFSGGVVFGHEFCAEVLEFGPDCTRTLKPGARVVSMPIAMTTAGVETIGYSPSLH